MPDIYQGAELWDLSLVDPDNRRPVDYELRKLMLDETQAEIESDPTGAIRRMMENWHDGRVKLAVTAALLQARQSHRPCLRRAIMSPSTSLARAPIFCARSRGVMALRPWLSWPSRFPVRTQTEAAWDDTEVAWPGSAPRWTDLLTGKVVDAGFGQTVHARDVLDLLPVAVLMQSAD